MPIIGHVVLCIILETGVCMIRLIQSEYTYDIFSKVPEPKITNTGNTEIL